MQASAGITTRLVTDPDDPVLSAVVSLADRHRSTLGLMPAGAFRELAPRGNVLAAIDEDGGLVGYALFSIAHGRVRLIHLCVDETQRGAGVAKTLVREVSDRHLHLSGIALKCRRDYVEATRLWQSLGFEPRHEVPGRGKDGATLVVWWLSHHLPDLFTLADDSSATTVAIDHNIFVDLAVDRGRPGAEASEVLEADWLSEQISLRVTKESAREIQRVEDAKERARLNRLLSRFQALDYAPGAYDQVRERWKAAVGRVPERDRSDCNHLLSAAAAGVGLFVTRDEALISRYGDLAADVLGLRVLQPSALVVHLDELSDSTRYRPVEVNRTEFTVSVYGADAETKLDDFLSHSSGERKSEFHARLRGVAADTRAVGQWVQDPDGSIVAAWAYRTSSDGMLDVPFFRTRVSTLGSTIGKLVTFQLRHVARERELNSVAIADPHMPLSLCASLESDGFREVGGRLVAAVLEVRDSTTARDALPVGHPLRDTVRSALDGAISRTRALDLERALWPAKLLDVDEMPSYLVPIQPVWARELFALEPALWGETLLGISREHVYYRTPAGNPTVPARIGWYASGRGRDRIGAVVAVSHLVAVDIAPAADLFRRNQHLGVYQQKDVAGAERGGLASALKFVDTELLANHVSWERLQALGQGRLRSRLQSPTMISSELFGAIYREGTRRDG